MDDDRTPDEIGLTPADISRRDFPRRVRGFDTRAVQDFLEEVSEQMAVLVGEVDRLRMERTELRSGVQSYEEREKAIQETLYAVRGLADQIRNEARHEADLVIREAKVAADRLLKQSREQVARIEEEVSYLRLERDAFEDQVRVAVEEHLKLIEVRRKEGEVRDRLRAMARNPMHKRGQQPVPSRTPPPPAKKPAGDGGEGP